MLHTASVGATIALGGIVVTGAVAQDTESAPSAAVSSSSAPGDELVRELLARIAALEAKVEALEARSPAAASVEAANAAPANVSGGVITSPAAEMAAAVPPLQSDQEEQDRLISAAFQRTLIERGGLLLPPRTLDIDPALRYSNSSTDRIVIDGFTILPVLVVGDIVSERVQSTFTELSATARIGLPRNMQVDVRLPFAYQKRNLVTAENAESAFSASDFGDLEIAFNKQLRHNTRGGPDLLGSLRWKTKTGDNPFDAETGQLIVGTGYNALNASFTAVKVLDPAVFFGGLSYTYNDAIGTPFGEFQPGSSYGFDLGMAIALNLNTSLSFAYDQQSSHHSEIDGVPIPGSGLTTGIFSVSASYGLSDTRTVNFSVGLGVTEDSPDVLVNFSMPLRKRF
jgi:hypothetical protein